MNCTLCRGRSAPFFQDKFRSYFRCDDCLLVFVPSDYWLSEVEEKHIYDLHENSPEDEGYRKFLLRLAGPLSRKISRGSEGLDFGCGHGPTLSILFEELGHRVKNFDKYYDPNFNVFNHQYDFITLTEVIEHLKTPHLELKRLYQSLRPGGFIGLMTKLVVDQTSFQSWHYKNDPTHICFYSKETFEWLSVSWNLKLEFIGSDVIILRKS